MKGDMKLIHIATHPARYEILKLISDEPLYAEEISRRTGINARVIRFHLSVLHKHELIEGQFSLTKKAPKKAAKFWHLTEIGIKILGQIQKLKI